MKVRENRGLWAPELALEGGGARAQRRRPRAGPGVKAACKRGANVPSMSQVVLRLYGAGVSRMAKIWKHAHFR